METQDAINEEEKVAGKTGNDSCCGPNIDSGMMPDCCGSIDEGGESCSMMSKCMKGCR